METLLEDRALAIPLGLDLGNSTLYSGVIENPILRGLIDNRETYKESRFHNDSWAQYPDCIISYA